MIDFTPVAEKLGRDLPTLAEQIWQVAEKIDGLGNRGISESTLSAAGLTIDFLTDKDAFPAIDGILFYRESQGKRDPFEGWMVRRHPSWQSVWCNRYGRLNPDDDTHGCKALAAMSEAARKAKEEALPRPHEFIMFQQASSLTTLELKAYGGLAELLSRMMRSAAFNLVMSWRNDHLVPYGALPITAGILLDRLFETWALQTIGELNWRRSMENKSGFARHSALDAEHEFFTPEECEHIRSGEITLKDLSALTINWPVPDVPEVLHVDDDRYKRIREDEKVYIDKKTRGQSRSAWAYPFKDNKEENGLIRWRRYADWLRTRPDLLGQLEDLRGKRALGVLYKSARFDYDRKEEVGHGEALIELLKLDDDARHDLIQNALEREVDDGAKASRATGARAKSRR